MFKLLPGVAGQTIKFPMLDSNGNEVSGLGATLTIEISSGAGALVPAVNPNAELGSGAYTYTFDPSELIPGEVYLTVNGAGCVQQNLVYEVGNSIPGSIEFTYTVTNSITTLPIADVAVWVTTDIAGNNIIWSGHTDAFGVARDVDARLPYLPVGTLYFWRNKAGFSFSNPDTESVS